MMVIRLTLLTTERLVWHCGAPNAKPKHGPPGADSADSVLPQKLLFLCGTWVTDAAARSYGTKLTSPVVSYTATIPAGVTTIAWLIVPTRLGAPSNASAPVWAPGFGGQNGFPTP